MSELQHCLEGLRTIRKVRRISPTELAERIGVTPASYSRYEVGTRRMYVDQLLVVAKRLGVRMDDLAHPLTEDEAALLCDARDKAAIAAGTFDQRLWQPGAPAPVLDGWDTDQ